MTTQLKFPIGSAFLTIEDRGGYVSGHPDYVTVAIREKTARGKAGRRIAVNFAVRRTAVFKLALQLLELADRMMPKTVWQESAAVGDGNKMPALVGYDDHERAALARLLPSDNDDPLSIGKGARGRYDNLKDRVAILRQAQKVLETCDGDTAGTLHMAQHTGKVPVQLVVDAVQQGVAP
ncbi:hypothetical protein R75461_07307 [Paraburkholderia nemoris]|uniref:hypothetical protein n=1 Tax=Paraburkholderia nemoris TaxID=2793076 RepID=UPI00190D6820|nr:MULTISPECIES: hypothetical protein [Paraburkholderia]MBK3786041.1 hypothetical protein [Paraburkholderia aspalathi]CAE6847341.1 hypothetical protein R75461_07307 [Paraburkholderia nemoris]